VANVAVFSESESAIARDVVGIDNWLATRVGRVNDAVLLADAIDPRQCIRHKSVRSQIGNVQSRLTQEIFHERQRPGDETSERNESRADRGKQHDSIHPCGAAAAVDHGLCLGGAGTDVHEENAFNSAEGFDQTVSVVETPDGDVDPLGSTSAREASRTRPSLVAFFMKLVYEVAADVAS